MPTLPRPSAGHAHGSRGAIVAVLAAAVLFGTAGTARELGPDEASSLSVGAARIAIGTCVLWLTVLVERRRGIAAVRSPGQRRWPTILLGGAGAVLASVPYFIAGFLDQPGLYIAGGLYEDSDLTVWNILALIGHGLMALTALGFVALVLMTRRPDRDDSSDRAPDNPWAAQTLEWITTSPAPADNFADVPVVMSAEPVLDLETASTASSSTATSTTGGDV